MSDKDFPPAVAASKDLAAQMDKDAEAAVLLHVGSKVIEKLQRELDVTRARAELLESLLDGKIATIRQQTVAIEDLTQLRAKDFAEIERLKAERAGDQHEIERLKKEWTSLHGVERIRFDAVERLTAENAELRATVDGVERARSIACFNIQELNNQKDVLTDQRAVLTAALNDALTLVEHMIGELRHNGIMPRPALVLAHKQFQERMRKLLDYDTERKPQ